MSRSARGGEVATRALDGAGGALHADAAVLQASALGDVGSANTLITADERRPLCDAGWRRSQVQSPSTRMRTR